MSSNDRSTSLVHSPQTRGERIFSRLTLGHLLAGTLLAGAGLGALTHHAMQETKTERVIPSIVFNWNFGNADLRMKAPPYTMPAELAQDTCEAGAFLGIEFRRDDSFPRMARYGKLRSSWFQLKRPYAAAAHQASGVTVLNVLHGTAAESMGLLPGDVIVEMDDMAVRSAAQLALEIRERCVGEPTELRVHRGDKVRVLKGTLRSRHERRCFVNR